jgi:hypothetical protein
MALLGDWDAGLSMKRIVRVVSDVVDIEHRYFCPDYPDHYFLSVVSKVPKTHRMECNQKKEENRL